MKYKSSSLIDFSTAAEGLEYVSDKFSFNTTGYVQGQNPVAILSNLEEEDGSRELSVDDSADMTDNSSQHVLPSMGVALLAILASIMI